VDEVEQPGAGAGDQELLKVPKASAERGPEIKEDGGGAVFQEDLVAADRGGAVVDSDGDCQIQPSRLSATASRLT